MKKIFTLAMMLMAAVTANAQWSKTIISKNNSWIYFVPKEFTFGEHGYFYVGKDAEYPDSGNNATAGATQTNTREFDIYDEDINLVNTIKIEESFVCHVQTGESWENPLGQYADWRIIKDMYTNRPDVTGFDDANYRVNTTSGDDWYFYWNPSDGVLYEHRKEADHYYWERTGDSLISLYFNNFDNGFFDGEDFYFSQTLFNDDDKFEYLMWSNQGTLDIVQEGGKILQSINLPNGSQDGYLDLIVLCGKHYLVFEDRNTVYFYLIEKGSTTTNVRLKQVPAQMTNAIYNLRGQKVRSVPSDGIYIQNGRKVVIKK